MTDKIVATIVPFPWFALLNTDSTGIYTANSPQTGLTMPLFTCLEYALNFCKRGSLSSVPIQIPLVSTAIFIISRPHLGTNDFAYPFVIIFDPVEGKFDPDHRYFPKEDILSSLQLQIKK